MAAHFAAQLALIAFAIVEVQGLIVRGDFSAVTKAGLIAAALFFALGLVTGELARRIMEETAGRELEQMIAASAAKDSTDEASARDSD